MLMGRVGKWGCIPAVHPTCTLHARGESYYNPFQQSTPAPRRKAGFVLTAPVYSGMPLDQRLHSPSGPSHSKFNFMPAVQTYPGFHFFPLHNRNWWVQTVQIQEGSTINPSYTCLWNPEAYYQRVESVVQPEKQKPSKNWSSYQIIVCVNKLALGHQWQEGKAAKGQLLKIPHRHLISSFFSSALGKLLKTYLAEYNTKELHKAC